MKDFEVLPHTADLKIRIYGTTLPDLFLHALIGMFQAIVPRAAGCHYQQERLVCPSLPIKRVIQISAIDRESLLVDFLSEALYLSDVHNEAYLNADIQISDNYLEAVLYGIVIEGFEVEIKAVTYHDLAVVHNDNGWTADIIFDI